MQLEYERVGWFSQVSTYYTKDRELEWRNLQNIPLDFAQKVLEEVKRFNPIEIMNDKRLDNVTAR